MASINAHVPSSAPGCNRNEHSATLLTTHATCPAPASLPLHCETASVPSPNSVSQRHIRSYTQVTGHSCSRCQLAHLLDGFGYDTVTELYRWLWVRFKKRGGAKAVRLQSLHIGQALKHGDGPLSSLVALEQLLPRRQVYCVEHAIQVVLPHRAPFAPHAALRQLRLQRLWPES